jgi:hypothetical protein
MIGNIISGLVGGGVLGQIVTALLPSIMAAKGLVRSALRGAVLVKRLPDRGRQPIQISELACSSSSGLAHDFAQLFGQLVVV